MRLALRAVAILIAAAALVDPAFRTNRRVPPPVTVLLDERDAEAQSVRAQLESALAGRVTLTDVSGAAAVVAIGDAVPERALASAAPLSTVALGGTPDVAIVAAPGSVRVHAGRAVALRVRLRGRGVAATTTTVGIEERGVELARVEHKWVEDGDATVSLSFFSPSSGVGTFEVRVVPAAGEHHIADNRVTVRALFDGRKPLIAMVEPRPSWPATFVRRVLEADRAFEVASIVRVSRGIATRGGLPPADISLDQLRRFDVVLVGAPEDLREGEVRALEQFAALRGGTVVLLPDRRPSGPYTAMLPAAPNEQLLTEPSAIEPSGVRASELLITPETRGSSFLATHDGRGVICRWPLGDGQLVFSGALDAWRFRGDPHGSFASFWRQTISEAAATAPPAVAIALEPAVVRPGQRARLTVRLRRSEFVGAARRHPGSSGQRVDRPARRRARDGSPLAGGGVRHLRSRHRQGRGRPAQYSCDGG